MLRARQHRLSSQPRLQLKKALRAARAAFVDTLNEYTLVDLLENRGLIGWSMQVVENAGAQGAATRLEERPWMHNATLTYVLTWS